MTLKPKAVVDRASKLPAENAESFKRYVVRSVPSSGAVLKDEDDPDQIKML